MKWWVWLIPALGFLALTVVFYPKPAPVVQSVYYQAPPDYSKYVWPAKFTGPLPPLKTPRMRHHFDGVIHTVEIPAYFLDVDIPEIAKPVVVTEVVGLVHPSPRETYYVDANGGDVPDNLVDASLPAEFRFQHVPVLAVCTKDGRPLKVGMVLTPPVSLLINGRTAQHSEYATGSYTVRFKE
jgi:hypothetical protein